MLQIGEWITTFVDFLIPKKKSDKYYGFIKCNSPMPGSIDPEASTSRS